MMENLWPVSQISIEENKSYREVRGNAGHFSLGLTFHLKYTLYAKGTTERPQSSDP
jgi:hypothetical protein